MGQLRPLNKLGCSHAPSHDYIAEPHPLIRALCILKTPQHVTVISPYMGNIVRGGASAAKATTDVIETTKSTTILYLFTNEVIVIIFSSLFGQKNMLPLMFEGSDTSQKVRC